MSWDGRYFLLGNVIGVLRCMNGAVVIWESVIASNARTLAIAALTYKAPT